MPHPSTNASTNISGGLSLMIDDRWIGGIMDEIADWEPKLGSQPHILEDLNFFSQFSPLPLTTV